MVHVTHVVALILACGLPVAAPIIDAQARSAPASRTLYERILTRTMPLDEAGRTGNDVEWVAIVRVRVPESPERWVRLEKHYGSLGTTYTAVAKEFADRPLTAQLDALPRNLVGTESELVKRLRIREFEVRQCSALDAAAARLQAMSLPLMLDDTIELDAAVYEFSGFFRSGRVSISLAGSEAGREVAKRILELADNIRGCRGQAHRN